MVSQTSLDIDGIFGSLLIGCFVACLLLGVTTAQLYLYLKKFSEDPIWVKSLAFAVWTLELCHQIMFSHVLYVLLIIQYGNPNSLVHAPKSIQALSAISGLIGFIVQGFFIYRIFQFSHSKTLLGFLSLTTSASLGLIAWPIVTTSVLNNNLLLYTTERSYVIISALCAAAFADMSISVSTIWLLKQRQSDVLQGGLSRVLTTLIVWTGETGLLTSGLLTFSAITAGIWKNTFICLSIWLVAYRVYSNTFFAALNGRICLRGLNNPSSMAVSRKERSAMVFAALPGHIRSTGEETNDTTDTFEV
ncbi:hypothetical protein DL96DRAFT_1826033 [Flagelloscypha sp. PMI_526]|nr:hypothetical protein DL96DRAFT_1826033 [Flagelloscypha sp. PMI_526]